MRTVSATRELLAPVEDVWSFVAEPHNLPNWWQRVGGVQPDRRGLAPGARWGLTGREEPSLLRRPATRSTLVVLDVEEGRSLAFRLVEERTEVTLSLERSGPARTRATLAVRASWWRGHSRALPRQALDRLWSLCQTGAA